MPKYWFDHIHLMSLNPVKTAEYYERMFGAEQISKRDLGDGRFFINLNLNGTTILVSSPRDDNIRTGLHHYGIRTDNLDNAVGELKANGVKFTQEITEIRPGFKISYFLAPDNVSVELQEGIP